MSNKKKNKNSDNLYIIIPTYNEENNIKTVVKEWHEIVKKIGNDSKLVVINDGSKDNTLNILELLKKRYECLVVLNKENGGHGDAVLYGYSYAIRNHADYIFQTDSDGQTLPEEFEPFWDERKKHDAIIGYRKGRRDGLYRIFVAKTLKLILFLIFHCRITDANTPYRLMSYKNLKKYYQRIPKHFNLPNILLTVLMVDAKEDVYFKTITFLPRQGGINSINLKKIIKIGIQAVKDFRKIKKEMKEDE